MTLTIDQLRRKLRDTEKLLLKATAELKSSKREAKELRKENQKLTDRIHKAGGILRPDGAAQDKLWDNYKEPGY
jgi:chromosome segregation ATPase